MTTLHKSCSMLKFNSVANSIQCLMYVKDAHIILKRIFQYLAQPSLFPRHNGKYHINLYNQEIQVFKVFFVPSSNLVLATESSKSMDRFVLKSVGFCRFMTSEGTETLILAFTSKTGKSIAHNRQEYFYLDFLPENGYMKAFQTPEFKDTRDRTKQIGIFAFFFLSILALLYQPQCSAMLSYGTTFFNSTNIHSTSPAGCYGSAENR